jgi:segregation and condensation protein B
MERSEQIRVVEALVLASAEPLTAARIAQIAPECTPALARDLVGELNARYEEHDHSFEIWEVAGGYQVRTKAEFSGYLQQLQKQRPLRLSRAALETLAIVAYKQPATRAEIEYVRGVDVGATLKSLMDRGLVKITGHKEVPGRPMIYATTRRFLETFGLDSIKALPELRELEELVRERAAKEEAGREHDAAEAPLDADSENASPGSVALGEAETDAGEAETDAGEAETDAGEAELDADDAELDADDAEMDADEAEMDADEDETDADEAELDSGAAEIDADEDGIDEGEEAVDAQDDFEDDSDEDPDRDLDEDLADDRDDDSDSHSDDRD